jgi:hypothetical protein
MLYWEIIAVCSEVHIKHANTLYGLNVEFFNVRPGGTKSNHWAIRGNIRKGHFRKTNQVQMNITPFDTPSNATPLKIIAI